jgi:hypothetical protein
MDSGGRVHCFASPSDKCDIIDKLMSPKRAIRAHDKALVRCTKEINTILRKVRESNSDKSTDLHLLKTPRGFILAWASCDGVCGGDDPAVIDKALGFK